MKKIIVLSVSIMLTAISICGCKSKENGNVEKETEPYVIDSRPSEDRTNYTGEVTEIIDENEIVVKLEKYFGNKAEPGEEVIVSYKEVQIMFDLTNLEDEDKVTPEVEEKIINDKESYIIRMGDKITGTHYFDDTLDEEGNIKMKNGKKDLGECECIIRYIIDPHLLIEDAETIFDE